jgi:hypothetical protein
MPNEFGNLDNEEQPLAMNKLRLCSSPKSSGSACTLEYDISRILNFVRPLIDSGRV